MSSRKRLLTRKSDQVMILSKFAAVSGQCLSILPQIRIGAEQARHENSFDLLSVTFLCVCV